MARGMERSTFTFVFQSQLGPRETHVINSHQCPDYKGHPTEKLPTHYLVKLLSNKAFDFSSHRWNNS